MDKRVKINSKMISRMKNRFKKEMNSRIMKKNKLMSEKFIKYYNFKRKIDHLPLSQLALKCFSLKANLSYCYNQYIYFYFLLSIIMTIFIFYYYYLLVYIVLNILMHQVVWQQTLLNYFLQMTKDLPHYIKAKKLNLAFFLLLLN